MYVTFPKHMPGIFINEETTNLHVSVNIPDIWNVYFWHDRSWISPWIKPIPNEFDITICVIAPQLTGHCDVISNRLWVHQQNVNRATGTRDRCVTIIVSIVIYGFVMSCKKWNNICTPMTNWRCSQSSGIVGFMFKHQNNPLVSASTVRH